MWKWLTAGRAAEFVSKQKAKPTNRRQKHTDSSDTVPASSERERDEDEEEDGREKREEGAGGKGKTGRSEGKERSRTMHCRAHCVGLSVSLCVLLSHSFNSILNP